MKLGENKRRMLTSIAQASRRLSFFTNGKDTGIAIREDVMQQRLNEMVEDGLLYEAESCYHITILGRQQLDNKQTAKPRTIVTNGETYRTGMCDSFYAVQRPGSDHSYLKSRGNLC